MGPRRPCPVGRQAGGVTLLFRSALLLVTVSFGKSGDACKLSGGVNEWILGLLYSFWDQIGYVWVGVCVLRYFM